MAKKLKPADQKFIDEFLKISEEDQKSEVKIVRANRFSGQEFLVSKVVAKCIDFVYNMEHYINTQNLAAIQSQYSSIKSIGGAIQKFDRARYVVLAIDREAYSGILD